MKNKLNKYKTTFSNASRFSKLNLTVFALIFAGLGSYFLFFSHAAGPVGDIDGNGTVGAGDLSILLTNYSRSETACNPVQTNPCDLDGDGAITGHDLSLLLANWGQGGGGAAPVSSIAPYFANDNTAVQGQTLSVNTGTWNPAPTSYTYQWQDCTTTAGQPPTTGSCAAISGATSASYTVQASDVGKALVPIVTAFNGSTASTPTTAAGSCNNGALPLSAVTGGITSFTNTDPHLTPGCSPISAVAASAATSLKFCTNAPATCGFADPLNQTAGVQPGHGAAHSGTLTCNGSNPNPVDWNASSVSVSSGCVSITNSYLNGRVNDNGITVTYNHDDITGESPHTGTWWNSHCTFNPNANSGDNVEGLYGGGGSSNALIVNNSYIHCAPEVLNGFWNTADHDYIISDVCWGPCGGQGVTTHNEAVYQYGGQPGWGVTNSVLYNSYDQTAALFADGSTGGQSNVTLTGNLFATNDDNGSLAMGACTGSGNSNQTITGNRFSVAFGAGGADAHGASTATWSGNILDATLATVSDGC